MGTVPSYLQGYEDAYERNPRQAALEWFRDANYGLFLHYGLYSVLGRHEWVQFREKIPVAEYEKLKEQFTAEGFDADYIARFAVDCGMKYVNITTRHHDSFCLFETAQTDFNSVNSPCGRDLVGELAEACAKCGLGLFLYYSHGRDWRHPHAPNNDEWGGSARPDYDPPEPSYAYGDEHDLDVYLEFIHAQIDELLTGYGPIAGIWLDGIATPLSGDASVFRCQELYDFIHGVGRPSSLSAVSSPEALAKGAALAKAGPTQPQVLVSYKQGLLGTEDFVAPEHAAVDSGGRPGEICTTMTPRSWGYSAEAAGQHLSADEVWEKLRNAGRQGYNLLLNTGPLPDGSIDPEDDAVLRAVGERLRREGFLGQA